MQPSSEIEALTFQERRKYKKVIEGKMKFSLSRQERKFSDNAFRYSNLLEIDYFEELLQIELLFYPNFQSPPAPLPSIA